MSEVFQTNVDLKDAKSYVFSCLVCHVRTLADSFPQANALWNRHTAGSEEAHDCWIRTPMATNN